MWRRGNGLLIVCLLSLVTAGDIFASPYTEIRQLVDDCVKRQFARQATVYQDAPLDLEKVCPDLSLQLDNEVLAQLQPPLQRETTFSQLHDVQRSLRSFTPAQTTGSHALDHAGLQALLDEVYEPNVKAEIPPNPIDKFWTWVGNKLREYLDEDNWLTRNFDFTPASDKNLLEGLKNTVIVILIVMVLYILISELHAANVLGLLKGRRRRSRGSGTATTHLRQQHLQNLRDISSLPPGQQAPALLRYAIRYLVERRVLPHQYSLTNQEFLALVRENLPVVARDFETLVSTGDQVLYGNMNLPDADTEKLYEHVRTIEHAQDKGAA